MPTRRAAPARTTMVRIAVVTVACEGLPVAARGMIGILADGWL